MIDKQHKFSSKIQKWYDLNQRDLPWRHSKDPYQIWLSEIILQQTRVAQGMAYYKKFMAHYPTVQDLAKASEEAVLKDWQGLGYYSRARNLHASARWIVTENGAQFPKTYQEILKLKGVGAYTAAAIASFAYDEAQAVLDGNVFRVLSRYFGLAIPIDSHQGKKDFQDLAQECLDKKHPAKHNQAIMEFGALLCTPKSPDCNKCPLSDSCAALAEKKVEELPVKQGKTKQRTRHLNFLVLKHQNQVLIQQRKGKGIWQNLYQFPFIESQEALKANDLEQKEEFLQWTGDGKVKYQQSKERKHILSHQILKARFYQIELEKKPEFHLLNSKWVAQEKFRDYPIPKLIENYVREESNFLSLPIEEKD